MKHKLLLLVSKYFSHLKQYPYLIAHTLGSDSGDQRVFSVKLFSWMCPSGETFLWSTSMTSFRTASWPQKKNNKIRMPYRLSNQICVSQSNASRRDVFHLEIHRISFQFSLTDISWTCFATNLSQVFKTHESSNSTDTNRNLLQNPNEDEQKSWGSLEKDGRARILLMCDWQSRGCSSWCYYVKVPRRVVAANQTRRIYVEYGWPNLLYQSMLSY